ncbi:zonular occludens toxin domain-containing protein [Cupriavidus sp. D39]|uniref:zonular occludens toxin domain-containing protein n=1 Tax=Cupriavidus sp. D39 TaxID=2997877 RepID=UPI00226FB6DF|nr:zonular occludens toxin domain-containing protein [Cupriavidus sp. D39]MCY0852701.1 zonular occludens toxin [Cupriavidus sp. D39]
MIHRPVLSWLRHSGFFGFSLLTLITGQPGNGKSLYTLFFVEEMRKQENRPVFYHGIPELTLDWQLLEDPTKWHECPPKSIIVIDEVQKVMKPRPSSSAPPVHVQELETHRHKGFDLFFMTQDPSLVDNHIKKLAGEHVHLIRQFGRQAADVFKMQKVQDPTNANLKRAQRSSFPYPKHVFEWYKSAEAHTHKKKLPLKYKLMFVLPFVVLAALGAGGKLLWNLAHPAAEKSAAAEPEGKKGASPAAVLSGPGAPGTQQQGGPLTPEQYVQQYAPRVAGLDYTAPVYDELTKPKRVPVPVACVKVKHGCACYSQQGTRLTVADGQCLQIVKDGFFMAFDADGVAPASGVQQSAVAAPVASPVAEPVRRVEAPPQYAVVPVAAAGRLGSRRLTALDLEGFGEDERVAQDPRNSKR